MPQHCRPVWRVELLDRGGLVKGTWLCNWVGVLLMIDQGFTMDRPILCVVVMLAGNVMSSI